MRGDDEQSGHLFSYLSPEQRAPADHATVCSRTGPVYERRRRARATIPATPVPRRSMDVGSGTGVAVVVAYSV
jgi:hypothetical protein